MNCERFRELVECGLASDTASRKREHLLAHAAQCADCERILRRELAIEQLLTIGLEPELRQRSESEIGVGRPLQLLRWAASAAVMLIAAVGGWVGGVVGGAAPFGPIGLSLLPAMARPNPNANMGFEFGGVGWQAQARDERGVVLGFEPGDEFGWKLGGGAKRHFEEIDRTKAHSGEASLKLYQREWGGTVQRTFPMRLPEGTRVTVMVWVYSPRGGTRQNKWLEIGLAGTGPNEESSGSVSLDVFAPSPHWRPYRLTFHTTRDTEAVSLTLTTGNGGGEHAHWDWATWIDDVSLEILVRGGRAAIEEGAGFFETEVSLPPQLKAQWLDPSSIRLVDSANAERVASGTLIPTSQPGTVRFRFYALEMLRDSRRPNPFSGGAWNINVEADFVRDGLPTRLRCGLSPETPSRDRSPNSEEPEKG